LSKIGKEDLWRKKKEKYKHYPINSYKESETPLFRDEKVNWF